MKKIQFIVFVCSITCIFLTNVLFFKNHTQSTPIRTPLKRIQPVTWTNPYNLQTLAPFDHSSLVNITEFQFTINNKRCSVNNSSSDELFLVIFVHSAPRNFDKRQSIRSTWGNENNLINSHNEFRLVFLVGQVDNPSLQKKLDEENDLYHDLVQGNFIDSYRNLTYKHVMGLKWVVYYCQNAKYIFKTDDDIFVDIFQLNYYLKGNFGNNYPPKNLIICYVIKNPYPKRSQRSKWRVTFKEYNNKYYPDYCAGWGILMSPDVVFNLYIESNKIPYFWVDDVFVSGLLVERLGFKHVDFNEKLALESDDVDDWLENEELTMPPLFGVPNTKIRTIYALWNKTVKYYKVKYKLDHLKLN